MTEWTEWKCGRSQCTRISKLSKVTFPIAGNPRTLTLWRELNVLAETDKDAADIVNAYRDWRKI